MLADDPDHAESLHLLGPGTDAICDGQCNLGSANFRRVYCDTNNFNKTLAPISAKH
jgi:hypothetical protein